MRVARVVVLVVVVWAASAAGEVEAFALLRPVGLRSAHWMSWMLGSTWGVMLRCFSVANVRVSSSSRDEGGGVGGGRGSWFEDERLSLSKGFSKVDAVPGRW